MARTCLSYTHSFTKMDFGPGHPLRGDRFVDFMKLAESTGFLDAVEIVDPTPASAEHLLMAHTQRYLDKVETFARNSEPLSADTPMSPGLPAAARMIVGGTLFTGEKALEHGICLGFGGMHHAARERGGGFCLYNDVAVLAQWLKHKGYRRILNMDTDAHCGDGTLDIFYEDPEVLYISTHQHPETLYPGRGYVNEIGSGEGEGYTVNIPLAPWSGLEDYKLAMEEIIKPVARAFKPDVVIRNGGSDPSIWDHLAMLGLDLGGLAYLGAETRAITEENNAPLVDLALSGYGEGIAEGWLALWRGVLGLEMDIPEPSRGSKKESRGLLAENKDMISGLKDTLSSHWTL